MPLNRPLGKESEVLVMDSCTAAAAYANSVDIGVWLIAGALWLIAITLLIGHIAFLQDRR